MMFVREEQHGKVLDLDELEGKIATLHSRNMWSDIAFDVKKKKVEFEGKQRE